MPLGKTLISGPYGSEVVPVSDSPAEGASLTSQVRLETAEVPISDAVLAQQPGFAQARAAREAELNRPESTMLEGAGAAVSLWSTTRLVKRLARPVFEEDRQGFNQFEAFEQLGMALTPDEREYISEVGKGPQSWQYAVQQVQDIRDAQRVFGDHPIVGFATSFLDPVWMVVPPAIRAGKLSPVAGRAVSAAFGAAGAGAITAAGEGPVSDADIALNMLMGAAGGTVFYKHGKLAGADPEFPEATLGRTVDSMEDAMNGTPPRHMAEDVYPDAVDANGPGLAVPKVAPTGEGRHPLSYDGAFDDVPTTQIDIPEIGKLDFQTDRIASVEHPSMLGEVSDAARRGFYKVDPTAKAVYIPSEDRVYLFTRNIQKGDDVQSILLHEVGVHMNGERVLGTQLFGKLLSELEERAARGDAKAKAAYAEVPKDTPLHMVREEALGYFIERNAALVSDGIVARVLTAAKQFLRKLGINMALSDMEIVTLIRKASKAKTEKLSFDTTFPYVWHGGPTRGFAKFDSAFLGQGEGNAAFGHGWYMPSEKGTALDYRNKESKRRGASPETGGLFRTKILRERDEFLDFDSTTQSARVSAALKKLGMNPVGKTGREVYTELTSKYGSQSAASQALADAGVAGNVYSTGKTRGGPVRNSNYVVFQDKDLDIAARYSKPGAGVQTVADAAKEVDKRVSDGQVPWAWNMHKTMSSFGDYGKQVADLLYDNNADLSIHSLESHREAILHDLRVGQHAYEDQLRKAMAEDGYGFLKMANPFTSREAAAAQQSIEREVQRELFRREQAARNGTSLLDESVPRRITEMADTLDAMHKRALAELKAAGVEGSENLLERPGYLNRKWSSLHIDNAIKKLEDLGLPNKEARAQVTGLVSLSLRRANGWDKELSDQIGSAIIDRALRKGYFEDTLFNVPAGEGQLKEMRDILSSSGMNSQQIERALDVLRVQTDEAGKAGIMKHRMDLDYRAQMRVGNETLSVMDLIDGRVATIVDQYNAQVATQAAFARMGFKRRSDIEGIRSKLLASVPAEQRRAAQELFDATIAHFRGEPAGAAINDKLRLMQAYGRSISLAWSGLWQMTEFANPMAQYGLMKTLKYAAQEIPGFKQIMNPTKAEARTLADVLANHSASSQRLRPYISRFEDGYEMDATNAMQLSAQTIGQSVPYANAMKNVHHFQAKVVGNLILDRLRLAAEGNPKAREALATYGLESPVMDKLKIEIDKHGFNVDAWDDNVWMAARPAFSKMMDSAVLRGRLGDIPAFAAFDPLGKFLFTYRSFVLVAHNKVLAGTYMREGAGAVGLALMYQFPLALAAVQAQSVLRGQGALSSEDATKKAMGQMGGIGLFSEPLKWATGESSEWGSPGTIPIDRGIRMFGNVLSGDGNAAASTALTMLPTVSAVPFINGMAKAIKE